MEEAGPVPVALPVALAPGGEPDCVVRGELRAPVGDRARGVVQLLVSGATYGRAYWDFPLAPERYSYARALQSRGYATLAIDRPGIGDSDHPDPELLDTPAHGHVVAQLVEALRAGTLGPRFDRVVLVGHSYGSVVAIEAAARGAPIAGAVITGLLHHLDDGLGVLHEILRPVDEDGERFAHLPAGYRTTTGARRGEAFYHLPGADPAVIARDEALKQTSTAAEDATFPEALARSAELTVPVLVLVGDRDRFFCTHEPCSTPETGGAAREAQAWTTASLTVQTVPDAGHSLNLHRGAPEVFARIADWCDATVTARP